MTDKVEQVAAALAQSFRETVARVSGDSWEETGVTLPSKEVWERYARAAIEAMREPASGMIGAGGVAQFRADLAQAPVRAATVAVYQAMIDAALASPINPEEEKPANG